LNVVESMRRSPAMFIRRTKARNGGAVRQRTLLNLGAQIDLPLEEWPLRLCMA
jgi:hypothetical protein